MTVELYKANGAEIVAEPVAWRFKHKHVVDDRWRFNDKPPQGEPWTKGEPLYAAPAPLPVAVKIKPLEWAGRNADGTILIANVTPMQYWAWELGEYGYWSWGTLSGREVHGGIDGAKAAAQQDYETRIRSALSSPVGGMEGGWRDIDEQAVSGERILLLWKPIGGLSEHVELGRFSKAATGWVNTYGKPFSTAPDKWAPLAPFFPTPVSDIAALREENERLKELADERESTRERMASDWFDFCEAMGVTPDAHEAIAYKLQAKISNLQHDINEQRDALQKIADNTAHCIHDGGFDRESGPIGCNLGDKCVCIGIHPIAASALSKENSNAR